MRLSRSFKTEAMEATMVREWVEAAGFVLVIAACYMMVIPV
ncbi:hypothetical protein [Neorhizobium galegae]|nr:hypothetical protein [Neorhizobium galegae]CDZ25895.1 Hypothetical protein NGAL_HAMBI490_07290 [Neorhizobium galegae bv. officinalis]CDZ36291.1 Hypothetical protein NGAL_HAMBI1146_17910 [Neorhizobium galegae bv. officinalis]